MSTPFHLSDREIQFLAIFLKHASVASVNMDAVGADMLIKKKHAQTLKSILKKKLSVYLGGTTTTSSSAGVRKPSTASTKRGNAGTGRSVARGESGRSGRAKRTTQASVPSKSEVHVLADDDENPFMEPKPAQPIETIPVVIPYDNEDEGSENHAGKTPKAPDKDFPLSTVEAPTEQVDEECDKDIQQIAAWDQDVIDWDARNAGLY